MSLRIRLVMLIVALVALVAISLSIVYLGNLVNLLANDALDRSHLAAEQVSTYVTDHITTHSQDYDPPADLDGIKLLWVKIVSTDRDIPATLVRMYKLFPAVEDINIAGPDGAILASSNPQNPGKPLVLVPSFADWSAGSFTRRILDLAGKRANYQVLVPLGLKGEAQPMFRIQVVVSSVLLRAALFAQLNTLAWVTVTAVLVSLLITLVATNRVLRPLRRIETTIDRIVQGDFRGGETLLSPESEFAAVEGKLNILGERFIGAREQAVSLQHNLDGLIERMATQLDVATRLAAISRISGSVAHEIKNPLNAISLRLDLLRARLGEPEDQLMSEIDILSSEVRRLDRVVKTFLDFSRPVELTLKETDLADIAKEVADLTTPQARLHKITIAFEGPSNPTPIRADIDMLKQAILNLVVNAIEAMKSGGNLWLRVSHNFSSESLDVIDDGPGIPGDVRDKVFQLYFTTKERGSGIGLAMTYRAMQLHNGTISFSSEPGRGTRFHLEFPSIASPQ